MNMHPNHAWTEENKKFIVEYWQQMTDKELSKKLNNGQRATTEKRYALGLKRFTMLYWELSEVEFLKQNYKIKGDTELARELTQLTGKEFTPKRIEKKRRSELNLKRTDDEILAIREQNRAKMSQNSNYIKAKLKAKETFAKRKADNKQKLESLNLRICELRNELIELNSILANYYTSDFPGKVKTMEIINMENRKVDIIKEIQILHYKLSRLPDKLINNADYTILKVVEWISITSVLLCLQKIKIT